MNVQPKLQTCEPGPMPDAAPAAVTAAIVAVRRLPGGPRRYATWEEAWPLELEVEPWHP